MVKIRLNKNTAKILLALVAGFNFGMLDVVFNMAEHGWVTLTVPFYAFTRITHWWWDLHCGMIMVCAFAYLCLDIFEKKKEVE